MVELEGVGFAAGATTILDGVTVRFAPRRFNVILGPNGAGKSTLLKIATGVLRPTSGAVRYGGRDVHAIPLGELARHRAVLSQHMELAFPLPVEDVVLMGRYPHYGRAPRAADRAIVMQALEVVGMVEKRRQPYPTLSGGEQQKVHLARVLSQIWSDDGGPATYLFLDEPTASLDIHYQIHLLDVAKALLQRDCTVVAVLHDLNTAFRYGDAFLLLDHGRVAAATDDAGTISGALLEQVFQVRAHQVVDSAAGRSLWEFSL